MPQGSKPITEYMYEVLEAAKRLPIAQDCRCEKGYTAERAARDAVISQTSNLKLRQKPLEAEEAPDFKKLLKIGHTLETAKEQQGKIEGETANQINTKKGDSLEERIARLENGAKRKPKPPGKPGTARKRQCLKCGYWKCWSIMGGPKLARD